MDKKKTDKMLSQKKRSLPKTQCQDEFRSLSGIVGKSVFASGTGFLRLNFPNFEAQLSEF